MNRVNLSDIGLNEQQRLEAEAAGERLYPVRVIEQHRVQYKVIGESGELQAEVSGRLDHLALEPSDYPAVGDWVLVDRLEESAGRAVIHKILSRKSCFMRKAAGTGGERQIIAANIDVVFICMALNADYNLRRLERYLSVVWNSGADPVVVLTKSDLCPDLDSKLLELEAVALGAAVVVTSGLLEDGIGAVAPYLLQGRTVAFVGSSGVGKSTLINRLLGADILITGELRNDDKGRHITTHRQLLILPGGAMVIDTPGMRELQLMEADLSATFADIEALVHDCRFTDCSHQSEPGCAIQKALREGVLSEKRFESYQKLKKELAGEMRRSTLNPTLAEKAKVTEMMGSLKAIRNMQKANRKKKGPY